MAKRRIWGKYERFRLRQGKDEDLYDAIDYQVTVLKKDFADVAREALRVYLGLVPGGAAMAQIAKQEQAATDEAPEDRKAARTLEGIQIARREPTMEELEKKADSFLKDE